MSQLGNSSADGLVFDTGLDDDEDDGKNDAEEDDGGDDDNDHDARKEHAVSGIGNRNSSNNGDHSTRWYESRIQRAERQHREYVLCQTRAQRSQVYASFQLPPHVFLMQFVLVFGFRCNMSNFTTSPCHV